MKVLSIVGVVFSGLGFIASLVALVVLIVGDSPFLPELEITEIISHPIAWLSFTGFFLFMSISDLKKSNDRQ